MKNVFYNCLFGDYRLPEVNDKIIYSYLVYKSLATIDGVFANDYCEFDFDVIRDFWEDNNYTEMTHITPYKIAKDLNMSINTVKSRMKVLEKLGFIKSGERYLYVAYTQEIKESKYFELMTDTKLKGEKLVVYSYLRHKSSASGGIIYTYDKKQALELYISKKHYQKILCELYKDYYIERLENGKLKIN